MGFSRFCRLIIERLKRFIKIEMQKVACRAIFCLFSLPIIASPAAHKRNVMEERKMRYPMSDIHAHTLFGVDD